MLLENLWALQPLLCLSHSWTSSSTCAAITKQQLFSTSIEAKWLGEEVVVAV